MVVDTDTTQTGTPPPVVCYQPSFLTFLLSLLDHTLADAVLHAVARLHALELQKDVGIDTSC